MNPADHPRMHCGVCGAVDFSARLVSLVVWAPGLNSPTILEPNDELRICTTLKCDAAWILATKSAAAHPVSRSAHGPWTMAAFVFADGRCFTLKAKRREVMQA